MPKISIIVPIYKAEKCIHHCVNSILNQTFKDFELILVDDGSPDNCGMICDEYAEKDGRIKVIHKENGGQSSARNIGVDIANGDYLGFVDSDDLIHPKMYEILYNAIKNFSADISCCDFFALKNHEDLENVNFFDINSVVELNENVELYTKDQVFSNYHDKYLKIIKESVWNKLIKRSAFINVRFNEKMIYEDEEILMYLIKNIDKIVITHLKLYYYNQFSSSTMRSEFNEKRFSALILAKNEMNFFKKNKSEYGKFLYQYCFEFISLSIIVNVYKCEYKQKFKTYKHEFIRLLPKIIINKRFCNMFKIVSLLSILNSKICFKICEKYFDEITLNIESLMNY